MLPILNPTGSRLEINTLFIQPTRWCGLSCKNCYVKEHQSSALQVPVSELFHLFCMFYSSTIAWANQITISVDSLPKHAKSRAFMIAFWYRIMQIIKSDRRSTKNSPDIHMTCYNEVVWQQYFESVASRTRFDYQNEFEATAHLDVLSLSNIKDLNKVKTLALFTHVNYNHLIPTNVTSSNINRYIERMTEIGRVVNSIYLITHKSPIGIVRDKQSQLVDQQRMISDLSYIKTMLERLPKDVRSKVHVDGCIKDVDKARKTGFGCSSNVSQFQVWPDGSVSGCPYAFSGNTKPAVRAEDILENIREARKTYDFRERCHLPTIIDSISR